MSWFDIAMYSLLPATLVLWGLFLFFFGEKSKYQKRKKQKQWDAEIDQPKTARISNNNTFVGPRYEQDDI